MLNSLISDHDFIFLLTDSREARWLPTLLCKAKAKPIINSALGFDSYLTMHHNDGMGCYFCNDIVAATNSRQRRPLDEQCTVTRPGLSFIAAALAVELMVAIIHRKEKKNDEKQSETDAIPHQIRGHLLGFTQMTLEVSQFHSHRHNWFHMTYTLVQLVSVIPLLYCLLRLSYSRI